MKKVELPLWQWLLLPITVALLPYLVRMIDPQFDQYLFGEFGLIENLTVIVLLGGITAGIRAWQLAGQLSWLRLWIVVLVIGAIYFAGEEISWGQHWLGWSTPETWAKLNYQKETNLHNNGPLFDQVPRTLLTLAAVIGGILVPVTLRLRQKKFPVGSVHDWLWPTFATVPACSAMILVSVAKKPFELLEVNIPFLLNIRAGEVKECLLAIFIMIYLLSLWKRLRAWQ